MPYLEDLGIARLRAENPGPLTLSGTNTWVVGRDGAVVIDPGPALPEHVAAVAAEVRGRGGLEAVLVTHDHGDHTDGIDALRQACGPAPVAGGAERWEVSLGDGDRFGGLTVVAAPGHAPDHLVYRLGPAAFTGDAVLGEGSVFISPGPGSLSGYLLALRRLRELELDVLCPGHGPPIGDPEAKLNEYLAHRQEREDLLLAALARGARTVEELLAGAWADVPEPLFAAARVTLAAHLDKLEEEGRLPPGVQRP